MQGDKDTACSSTKYERPLHRSFPNENIRRPIPIYVLQCCYGHETKIIIFMGRKVQSQDNAPCSSIKYESPSSIKCSHEQVRYIVPVHVACWSHAPAKTAPSRGRRGVAHSEENLPCSSTEDISVSDSFISGTPNEQIRYTIPIYIPGWGYRYSEIRMLLCVGVG